MEKIVCEPKVKSFEYLFKLCCTLSAIFLILLCCYKYNLDEDLVHMEFRKFHSTKDRVYPALTLCFDSSPNLEFDKLSTKKNILKQKFFQIGSNHTTLKIEEYIERIQIKDFSNQIIQYSKLGIDSTDQMEDRKLSVNAVLRRYQTKPCFAIGIPYMKMQLIKSMDIVLKKNIFQTDMIPTWREVVSGKGQFSLGLSYQNQFFPLLNGKDRKIESQNINNTCLNFVFHIRGMEILRRRNKYHEPCNEYVDEEAEKVLDTAAVKLRCKPPGWDIPSPLPACSKVQLDQSRNILDESLYDSNEKRLMKPCRTILDLWYDYDFDDTVDWCNNNKEHLRVSLIYDNTPFKEISLVPAHTIWSIISNIGVIIGFFFGFSMIQLPRFIQSLRRRLKKNDHRSHCVQNDQVTTNTITEFQIRLDMMEKELALLKHPVIHRLRQRDFETSV